MKRPACDFPLANVEEVSGLVAEKLKRAEPFSLVRIGDGEGLLLSLSEQSPRMDFDYLARHLGSKGFELDFVRHLQNRLIESILDADVIGVRDDIVNVEFEPADIGLPPPEFLEKFRKRFKLREAEKSLDYHGSRRIAFAHATLGNLDLKTDGRFCSAWFHYDYHVRGAIFRTLSRRKRIGLISCRSRLPGMLEDMFDIAVAYHPIPDFYGHLPAQHAVSNYIERFENLLAQRLVDRPGMLFLVGGGLYGKLLCGAIKSQGGVALDLGSLLDAWLGIPSRPTVLRSKFNMRADAKTVPPELLLTRGNIDRLLNSTADNGLPGGD